MYGVRSTLNVLCLNGDKLIFTILAFYVIFGRQTKIKYDTQITGNAVLLPCREHQNQIKTMKK
jgi:hypothetical protein